MSQAKNCVVLIGMPGAGKSTLGVLLAKRIAKDFVDTDVLIQVQAGRPLHDILGQSGYQELRKVEENVLIQSSFSNHVIATGGSAVYSQAAMAYLQSLGIVVYLKVSQQDLLQRIGDFSQRGIACAPGMDFSDIYKERTPLYERYADITIDETGKSTEEIVDEIQTQVASL